MIVVLKFVVVIEVRRAMNTYGFMAAHSPALVRTGFPSECRRVFPRWGNVPLCMAQRQIILISPEMLLDVKAGRSMKCYGALPCRIAACAMPFRLRQKSGVPNDTSSSKRGIAPALSQRN